jgi:hypothetical protein
MKACKYCGVENQDDAAQCYVCHTTEFAVPVPASEATQPETETTPAAKPSKPIKAWFRWMVLILTIGGGFTGLALIVQGIFQLQTRQLSYLFLYTPFVILYGSTIVSGLLFADNPKNTILLKIALIAQIPWFSSPVLAYSFGAGLRITAGILGDHLNASFRIGSDFQISYFQGLPWGIGVNVFALAVLVLLLRFTRASDSSVIDGNPSQE